MQENQANDFYERIVHGKDYYEVVELQHHSGDTLPDFRLHPVDKTMLAYVIQKLPSDMFDAVEQADSPEEAEALLEENGGDDVSISALNDQVVEAFEKLVKESATHPELTETQVNSIIDSLDFGILFELGGKVIDMSFAKGGAIKDFREQE